MHEKYGYWMGPSIPVKKIISSNAFRKIHKKLTLSTSKITLKSL
jgi:hypothetical protein